MARRPQHRTSDPASILAVRVGLFHRDPERAQRLASTWLAPGGRIRSFYDPPSPRR